MFQGLQFAVHSKSCAEEVPVSPLPSGRGGSFGTPENGVAQRWLRIRVSLHRVAGVAVSAFLRGCADVVAEMGCRYVSAPKVWQGSLVGTLEKGLAQQWLKR